MRFNVDVKWTDGEVEIVRQKKGVSIGLHTDTRNLLTLKIPCRLNGLDAQ